MKKLLILAATAALVLAASCTKNETVNNVPAEQHLIGFTHYAPKALTKTDASYVSGNALTVGTKFGVYAWAVGQTSTTPWTDGKKFDGTGNPVFMNNVEVTYGGDNAGKDGKKNTYSPMRYWPAGDTPDGLSFFAYYPFDAITLPATALGEAEFTVKAAAKDQVDLMVSDVVADQYYGHTNGSFDGTVDLMFHHALTKVQVKFKKATGLDAATEIKITAAKFTGVNSKGTLATAFADGATTYTWKGQGTPADFEVYFPAEALTETASTVANDDIFLMIPQNMEAQALEITWTVKSGDVTTTNTKTLSLKDDLKKADTDDAEAATINWERNHSVVYTITVGPKPILFTADVTPWEADETGYFNVQ